jgi:hypothetical protein
LIEFAMTRSKEGVNMQKTHTVMFELPNAKKQKSRRKRNAE